MKLKAALFATGAAMFVAPAANAYEGLYGAIGAGLSYMQPDNDIESAGGGSYQWDGSADYDQGIGIYTAIGYDYGNNWRGELEFSYRSNDIRHISVDAGPPNFFGWPESNISGDLTAYTFMANLIRDFDFGSDVVTPYLGVGVGFSQVSANLVGSGPSGALLIDDSSREFTWQGIAGLAFALAENLALDISYRYVGMREPSFAGTLGSAQTVNAEFENHSLFAGLRWNFGAAPARAAEVQYKDCWDGSSVPTTAECPPQLVESQTGTAEPIEVIVYFDYDKANLTPEAAELIREAAARALANNVNTVKVEGNADRSGSAQYNQALSQTRANVVRDALIANGIDGAKIDTSAFGEDNPAKPTPDGVREPLNRRTEVTISFQ